MKALGMLFGIALRDYVRDRRYGLVSALVLTSVLAPILVLFGIKNGIVEELFDQLRKDPSAVEVRPIGQGQFDGGFFAALRERPDVRYVIPTTRFLSSTISLRNLDDRSVPVASGELTPTSAGDPLAGQALSWDGSTLEVVLSKVLAEKLKLSHGQILSGRLGRYVAGRREAVDVRLKVKALIPLNMTSRNLVLVPLDFLLAAEDYREGFRVGSLHANGKPRPEKARTYASFRLYVNRLEDVEPVRDHLASLDIETKTALARIKLIQTLDSALSTIFWIVAGLATFGYALAASVQTTLIVIRKTSDLAVLKLLGFSSPVVAMFPVVQSTLTGLIGASGAIAVYYLAEIFINKLVGRLGIIKGVVAWLPIDNALSGLLMTLAICIVTSVIGGVRAARIYPVEGLRHD